MKKSAWKHKKYSARVYEGHYFYFRKQRQFQLVHASGHEVSFESHEKAKAAGWQKIS